MKRATSPASPGLRVTLREVPGPVWALLVGTTLNKVGSFLQLFLAFYLTRRGFGPTEVGIALSAYAGGAILGTIGAGGLTDRLGSRSVIVGSMMASGVFTAGLGVASSRAVIFLTLAMAGAASQACRPAVSSLLATLTPEPRRVMTFALYRLAFNVGMTVGPLLGALLVTRTSFAWLLIGDGITSAAYGVIALVALPKGSGQERVPITRPERSHYSTVLRDRRYRWFVVALLLNSMVYMQHLSTLPLHLAARGSSARFFGILIAVNALLVVVAEVPLTRLVQHWPPRLAVGLGILLVGLGLNLYAGPSTAAWLIFATVVWSMGEVVATPTAWSYPALVAPPELLGRYLGVAEGMQTLGFALGPVIGTTLFARLGGGVWWTCSLAAVVAALAAVHGMGGKAPSRPTQESQDSAGEPAMGVVVAGEASLVTAAEPAA